MILGGIGSLLLERFLFPYFDFLAPNSPLVITRHEEIRISEGVNFTEVANRTKSSLARVYVHEREFDSPRFRLIAEVTGVIASSDGLIAAPLPDLKTPGQLVTIIFDSEKVLRANLVAADPLTGLSLLKVDAKDLSVLRQGFAREGDLGDRLIVVESQAPTIQSTVLSAFLPREPGLLPSLDKTYKFGQLNDPLETSIGIQEKYLGSAVMNKDAVLVGLVTRVGQEIMVVKSEDYKMLLDNYFDDKKIVWPKLDLSYNFIGGALSTVLGFSKKYGILVRQAAEPLKSGDFIYRVDGKEISPEEGFDRLILPKSPGTKVRFDLIRDGKEIEIIHDLS